MSPLSTARAPRSKRSWRLRASRGQSMVEYSMVTWVLVGFLVIGTSVPAWTGPGGEKNNLIEMFLKAYQTYYDSFYFVLNMPYP